MKKGRMRNTSLTGFIGIVLIMAICGVAYALPSLSVELYGAVREHRHDVEYMPRLSCGLPGNEPVHKNSKCVRQRFRRRKL